MVLLDHIKDAWNKDQILDGWNHQSCNCYGNVRLIFSWQLSKDIADWFWMQDPAELHSKPQPVYLRRYHAVVGRSDLSLIKWACSSWNIIIWNYTPAWSHRKYKICRIPGPHQVHMVMSPSRAFYRIFLDMTSIQITQTTGKSICIPQSNCLTLLNLLYLLNNPIGL